MAGGRGGRIAAVAALLLTMTVVTATRRAEAAELGVPQAFPTIQAALSAASTGDTVVVGAGTYRENIDFGGKDVTLRSASGPQATTIAANGGTTVRMGPGGVLRGFTVTGGTATFGAGMEVRESGSVIEGNVFSGNTQGTGGFGAAIGGNGASPVIRGNRFRANSCDEQFLSGVVTFINGSNPTIANNIFENNSCRAIDIVLPVPYAPTVVNNTIVHNRTGIYVAAGVATTGHVYRNNILVDNGVGFEVASGSPATNPAFDHNLVSGTGTHYVGVADMTGTQGNISGDPVFVNAAANDYHLRPTSPAIDAGVTAAQATIDFDGTARPVDGNADGTARPDIGAFEFVPRPVISTTVTALTASPNPAPAGAGVVLRATVTAPGATTSPTGSVQFSVDGGPAGLVPLAGGAAALLVGSLPGGSHLVVATYGGDSSHAASSASLVVVVAPDAGTTACTHVVRGNLGPLVLGAGSWCLEHANVVGAVTVQAGAVVTIRDSNLTGGLRADGAQSLRLCRSTVAGPPVVVRGTTGGVTIGDPLDPSCPGNTLPALTLEHNAAVVVGGNTVAALRVSGTAGIARLQGNAVLGSLTCSGNGAVTNGGRANSVVGSRLGQCSTAAF